MYNYNEIETYASWILEEIKKSKKNHKKANMTKIRSWGTYIGNWAEQNLCFEHNKIPVCGINQF